MEISVGMGPENWLAATERFWRKRRWVVSGERAPERLRPERSKEVTWRRESQVTPVHVQWLVVAFHAARDDWGSSVMEDFIASRALYSGIVRD